MFSSDIFVFHNKLFPDNVPPFFQLKWKECNKKWNYLKFIMVTAANMLTDVIIV